MRMPSPMLLTLPKALIICGIMAVLTACGWIWVVRPKANDLFSTSSLFLDFGTLDNNGIASKKVSIRNTSDTSIRIKAVGGCGCFVGLINQPLLLPNEQTDLMAIMRASLRGKAEANGITRDLIVVAVGEDHREARQRITGRAVVREVFRIDPTGIRARPVSQQDASGHKVFAATLDITPTNNDIDIINIHASASNRPGVSVAAFKNGKLTLHLTDETFASEKGVLMILKIVTTTGDALIAVPIVRDAPGN